MRPTRLLLVLGLALGLWPGAGAAAREACPQHFRQGEAPALENPKLAPETQLLCYSGYATLHSGLTRTPLWSAEHLTGARVAAARDLSRIDSFHPDPNIPEEERAELSDYARSGFDRGHMAPSGDMGTARAMTESFSLANVVPQNPDLNRHLWERIERAVRDWAVEAGELYVVTGPVFQGATLRSLKGRVLVPTQVFKAVYDPSGDAAGAYLADNAQGGAYRVVSLDELRRIAGIDIFPGLPEDIRRTAADLPAPGSQGAQFRPRPMPPSPRSAREQPGPKPSGGGFIEGILNAIDRMGRRP